MHELIVPIRTLYLYSIRYYSSMRYLLIIALTLSTQVLHAHSADSARGNTLAIKGKVLPWLAGPEGINYTLGIEYGFAKRHSIGIDFVYNDYSFPNEVYDSTQGSYRAGPRAYTVSRGVFINYRRYYMSGHNYFSKPLNWLSGGNGGVPYLSAFLRYGKLDLHYPDGYTGTTVSYDEWQYSGGFLFGTVVGIFDFNTGPFYKEKYIHDVQQGFPWGSSDVHSISKNFGWRLGVNLFFNIKRNSNHYLALYDSKVN